MTIEYLRKAEKTASSSEDDTRKVLAEMLLAIEAGGEEKAREFALNLQSAA